ncbi:MAG: putative sugar nucleotidyl transferase [Bacteroidota bacterium]
MKYCLFEDEAYIDLLPLTFIRPVYELQVGIFSFLDRWKYVLGRTNDVRGVSLRDIQVKHEALSNHSLHWINARFLPEADFLQLIHSMGENTCYLNAAGEILCFHTQSFSHTSLTQEAITIETCEAIGVKVEKTQLDPPAIRRCTDLFSKIPIFFNWDFDYVLKNFPSQPIRDRHTAIYGKDNIWVGEEAKIEAAILHAENGPIYLGPYAAVQPGAIIMGGHAIGRGATVGIGAKLRADSVIGAHAKVAGEVKNSLISAYANKGHEGYMGNTVIGVGCNWGADTNVSNMKNTFSTVKQWSYRHRAMQDTSLNFCGTIMGDYSRTGINTMLNTGTVTGVSAHVFGEGFPPKFIPSFSWGKNQTYELTKAVEGARRHLALKGRELSSVEEASLSKVFKETSVFRSWE